MHGSSDLFSKSFPILLFQLLLYFENLILSSIPCTVAVPAPAEGLSTAQVATITDVIVSETDYTAPQIKVIEVKADAQDAQ